MSLSARAIQASSMVHEKSEELDLQDALKTGAQLSEQVTTFGNAKNPICLGCGEPVSGPHFGICQACGGVVRGVICLHGHACGAREPLAAVAEPEMETDDENTEVEKMLICSGEVPEFAVALPTGG